MHDATPSALLVATDMSPRGDRALSRAMDLAAAFGAHLTVLHVVDEDLPAPVRDTLHQQAERLLLEQVAALPGSGNVDWRVEVVAGVDAADIVGRAEAVQAGLILLGMHRDHPFRGIVFGTTAQRVMRTGTCPVLVVKGAYRGPYQHVLAAVDASPAGIRAVQAAARCWPRATVQAVHVQDMPGADLLGRPTMDTPVPAAVEAALRGVAEATGHRPLLAVEQGEVAAVLCRMAERVAADLITIGSAGGNRPMRALLGGTADRVLNAAACDVLVVPAPGCLPGCCPP